jgi:hypothetical protein
MMSSRAAVGSSLSRGPARGVHSRLARKCEIDLLIAGRAGTAVVLMSYVASRIHRLAFGIEPTPDSVHRCPVTFPSFSPHQRRAASCSCLARYRKRRFSDQIGANVLHRDGLSLNDSIIAPFSRRHRAAYGSCILDHACNETVKPCGCILRSVYAILSFPQRDLLISPVAASFSGAVLF